MPKKVFLSYSHKDKKFLEGLFEHMAILEREKSIDKWFDGRMLVGDKIEYEIDRALNACELFVALLSPSYFASESCYTKEFLKARALAGAKKITIIGVVIKPCGWLETPFKDYKLIPRDGEPVSRWRNRDNAYLDVIKEVRAIIRDDNSRYSDYFAKDVLISSFKSRLDEMKKIVSDANTAYTLGLDLARDSEFDVRMSSLLVSSYLLREMGAVSLAVSVIQQSTKIVMSSKYYSTVFRDIEVGDVIESGVIDAWKRHIWFHARALFMEAEIASDQNKLTEALSLSGTAIKLSRTISDNDYVAELSLLSADIERRRGNLSQAEGMIDKAVSLLKDRDEYNHNIAFAYCSLAHIHVARQKYQSAIEDLHKAVSLAKKLEDPLMEGIFYGDMANSYLKIGNLEVAMQTVDLALRIVTDRKHQRCVSYFHGNRGDILFEMDKKEDSLREYEESVRVGKEINNAHCIAKGYDRISRCYLALGRRSEAASALKEGIQLSGKYEDEDLEKRMSMKISEMRDE